MKEILNVIHKTIYRFFDACEDDKESPMSDKDKLLLEVNKAICNNLKALEQEPERKTGKWIEGKKTPGYIKWNCSECGLLVRNSQKPWYEYCPKCGARMEVGK